jgi:hypothetical protein
VPPKIAAQVEQTMATLREGPKPLVLKQIAALSGELYKGFAHFLVGRGIVTDEGYLSASKVTEGAP